MSEQSALRAAAAEVEAHVGQGGWDRPPAIFALVRTGKLREDEPDLARRMGLEHAPADGLTPVEQDWSAEEALDEALARLAWPAAVDGCALSQEIIIMPPAAAEDLPDDPAQAATQVAAHPQRQEARVVVAVLRDGSSAAVLRLRAQDADTDGELLTGADLAPNLARALVATLAD